MYYLIISVLTIVFFAKCSASNIYHEKSKITFYPDQNSSYFGYSVVLSNSSVIVGAPKAVSRVKAAIAPGQVFTCELKGLDERNITCYPLGMGDWDNDRSTRRIVNTKEFFKDDMWFGATIAAVPERKLFVCAPRWIEPYKETILLQTGICYFETKKRGFSVKPLHDRLRLAFLSDGTRKEYTEYSTHLTFHARGQAGMSIKVTENNSIIIGAPGLMQEAGGVIIYKFATDPNSMSLRQLPITNLYYTSDLGPDDYFGYSVESGTFENDGGTLYVAGAPRSKQGYGQVFIFEPTLENYPLKIHATVRGPQLGSYFGATLCCTDLNGDGKSDLLVGAPNFVEKEEGLPYDQGAVFVYLAGVTSGQVPSLIFEEAGHVSGSRESGVRFGWAIAALGDVDGDGYNDVAVGAPWEMGGVGAVYIYKGSPAGLKAQYVQKIIGENAGGFGISISKGLDMDGNSCSELAVGAHSSGTAYLYRCIPTIVVHASIKVPDAMNLPKNVTSFSTMFCVNAPTNKIWNDLEFDLKVAITIDPESNRASSKMDSDYKITAKPGITKCDEQTIEVKPTADLTKPILIVMDLEVIEPIDDLSSFPKDAARLSEDSTMHNSFLIQLIRDCGDDLICTPSFVLTLEAIDSIYVPGTTNRLGVKVTVFNKEEPAYGAKIYLRLPLPPKRVPGFCSLEGLNMTCDVQSPLEREQSEEWEIELEYSLQSVDEQVLKIEAELKHPLYIRNENDKLIVDANITVVPRADFKISGKTLPNDTMTITREKFYEAGNVSFVHYFEITNLGPSDWVYLEAQFIFPENVTFSNSIKDCETSNSSLICTWSVPATTSIPVALPLKYDLKKYGNFLEDVTTFNATTKVTISSKKLESLSITTKLVLYPEIPIWPFIVAIAVSVIIGLLLLAGIVYGLKRCGFFSRKKLEVLGKQKEQEDSSQDEIPGCSTCPEADESTQELISEDSDL